MAASLVLTTDLSLLAAITGFGAGVTISAAAGRLGAAAFGLFLAAAIVVESCGAVSCWRFFTGSHLSSSPTSTHSPRWPIGFEQNCPPGPALPQIFTIQICTTSGCDSCPSRMARGGEKDRDKLERSSAQVAAGSAASSRRCPGSSAYDVQSVCYAHVYVRARGSPRNQRNSGFLAGSPPSEGSRARLPEGSRGSPGVEPHCESKGAGFQGRIGCAGFVHLSHPGHGRAKVCF